MSPTWQRLRQALRIDASLPAAGAARWVTIAGMVVGGLVALFVPAMLALLVWSSL